MNEGDGSTKHEESNQHSDKLLKIEKYGCFGGTNFLNLIVPDDCT
ncbi:hypothetical protein J2X75_003373 [Paenibacillus sp. 2003]|nr:hypothetical protein [Paenibacillus sp. 2003]